MVYGLQIRIGTWNTTDFSVFCLRWRTGPSGNLVAILDNKNKDFQGRVKLVNIEVTLVIVVVVMQSFVVIHWHHHHHRRHHHHHHHHQHHPHHPHPHRPHHHSHDTPDPVSPLEQLNIDSGLRASHHWPLGTSWDIPHTLSDPDGDHIEDIVGQTQINCIFVISFSTQIPGWWWWFCLTGWWCWW